VETDKIRPKTLIVSSVAIFLIEMAARFAVLETLCNPMAILGMARVTEIILILLIVLYWGEGLSSIGLARTRISFGFKKGLIWSAGFGLVAFLVFGVPYIAGINTLRLIQMRFPVKGGDIILFFLVGGIVAPVAEEIFFRGLLYGFFRRWGVVLALIASTLIFVLFHPFNHGIPLPQIVGGIVFAVAYELEGSLMVPITVHALGNLAIFSLSLFI
jgi:membrane protease YdiL (CAAX protease family)